MSAIAPSQPTADGAQLTKPTDWAHFMVTAALKFACDEKAHITYPTQDEARLDILNTLNWYEAHSEYEWPNFSTLGYDFSQAMRFRRALVHDVYVALQRAGNVRIANAGVLATPESAVAGKRGGVGGRRMAERKRQCKREDGSDTDEDEEKPFWNDDEFLAETMHELINRSGADVASYLGGNTTVEVLANIVHDGLVEVWDGPVADYGRVLEGLERKRVLWAKVKAREESSGLGERRIDPSGH